MPRTSARSTSLIRSSPRQLSSGPLASGSTAGASGTSSSRRTATTCASERTAITVIPGTIAASSTWVSGTITHRTPRAEAAIAIGSTPGTERSRPSRVSSPTKTTPASAATGIVPEAASVATAIARSKCGPRLGRSAGESRIVTRRVAGHSNPLLVTAARHRSRASLIEASGRPTIAVLTTPWERSTWTSIRWPVAPCSEIVRAVATAIRPHPARGRARSGPTAAPAPRPGRCAPRRGGRCGRRASGPRAGAAGPP